MEFAVRAFGDQAAFLVDAVEGVVAVFAFEGGALLVAEVVVCPAVFDGQIGFVRPAFESGKQRGQQAGEQGVRGAGGEVFVEVTLFCGACGRAGEVDADAGDDACAVAVRLAVHEDAGAFASVCVDVVWPFEAQGLRFFIQGFGDGEREHLRYALV